MSVKIFNPLKTYHISNNSRYVWHNNEIPSSAIYMSITTISAIMFRFLGYCRHYLCGYHSCGEGIHSPYLFYLVRMVSRDENAYYVWHDIEQQRSRLLGDRRTICVSDYGTGRDRTPQRLVCDIARRCLERPKMGQLFFRWLVFLSHNSHRPLQVVELGTSFGITTSYLSSAHSDNQITTFEGCRDTGQIAHEVWHSLGLNNIRLVQGNIDDTLLPNLPLTVDFAFVDANHTESATLRYVKALLPRIEAKSIVVIDDIHYSAEMEHAWQILKALPQVTTTMDFYHAGALFFDPHYLKKHYRMRP